ncbi:TRAP transporter substrate-binding protein DctP [Burkholderia territorii]|uniref:TRAP transporter substrate-binding protein DctP n=1 Tax=Burkholderia territorii TaxID=1503055 RepID=UPI0009BE3CDC|nr:TRAP transporter substrate-binding protein DctP [Burkholderia territorii]
MPIISSIGRLKMIVITYFQFILFLPHAHAADTLAWSFVSPYPADTASGKGLETFAHLVNQYTNDRFVINLNFNSKIAPKTLSTPARINNIQGYSIFSGSITTDPLFDLPTLPFIIESIADSQQLAVLAYCDYALAFQKQGWHLLYISPWPPTGLWSTTPISDNLSGLVLRVYDQKSAFVMQAAGAKTISQPFQEAIAHLHDGTLSSILSSGDGATFKQYIPYLRHFTNLQYAFPFSFVIVDTDAYNSLPSDIRQKINIAAADTQRLQWSNLASTISDNHQRMEAAGVIIHEPTPELITKLRASAHITIESWRERAGPRLNQLLDTFITYKANKVDSLPTCIGHSPAGYR